MKYTKRDYDMYMDILNKTIEETENRLKILEVQKKISQLSFEEWVEFQENELIS